MMIEMCEVCLCGKGRALIVRNIEIEASNIITINNKYLLMNSTINV